MANFTLTNEGAKLLARNLAGEGPLKFTTFRLGSGHFTGDVKTITNMVNQFGEWPIITAGKQQDNITVRLDSITDNQGFLTPKELREKGVYCQLGDDATTEILYSYVSQEQYEILIPDQNTPWTKTFKILAQVNDATSITVNVTDKKDKYDFNNIEEMKAASYLVLGDKVNLWGYYSLGDDSSHKRIINNTDDGSGILLNNGLFANLEYDFQINVKHFGAKGDGTADDTMPCQRALDFASSQGDALPNTGTGASVWHKSQMFTYFPKGKYNITSILKINSYVYLRADKSLMINNTNNDFIFGFEGSFFDYNIAGWVGWIEGFIFQGNALKLNSRQNNAGLNLDQGKLSIKNCDFLVADLAIDMDLQSVIVDIESCKWDRCKTHINDRASDMLVISKSWMTPRANSLNAGESFFYINGSKTVVQNCIFVPLPQTDGQENAWFEIRDGLNFTLNDNRFGGEPGSIAFINSYYSIKELPNSPTQVRVINNYLTNVDGSDDNSTSVRLFDLPNSVIYENNNGMVYQAYAVSISETIDKEVFFSKLKTLLTDNNNRRIGDWISYKIDGNASTSNYRYNMIHPDLRILFDTDLREGLKWTRGFSGAGYSNANPLNPLITYNGFVGFKINMQLMKIGVTDNDQTLVLFPYSSFQFVLSYSYNPFGSNYYKANSKWVGELFCDFDGSAVYTAGEVNQIMNRDTGIGSNINITDIYMELSNGTISNKINTTSVPNGVYLKNIIILTDSNENNINRINSLNFDLVLR